MFSILSSLGQKWSYNELTHSSSTLLDAVEYLNVIEDSGFKYMTWVDWCNYLFDDMIMNATYNNTCVFSLR